MNPISSTSSIPGMSDYQVQKKEIISWPKAEPHSHFEGTVSPLLLRDLARNNQIDLFSPVKAPIGKDFFNPEAIDRFLSGQSSFSDFSDFIVLYLKITECLATSRDILETGEHYLEQLQSDSIVAADCYFTPTSFAMFGRNMPTLFDALREFSTKARQMDVSIQWIFDIVRNVSMDGMEVFPFFDLAESRGLTVRYLGLAGDESVRGAKPFVKAFEMARARKLATLAHSGESGSPVLMEETLRLLKPDRIGHGIAALKNEKLRDSLVNSQIPLEVAPWSNIILKFTEATTHPIGAMIQAGLNVLPAADDPGIFQKSLSENYLFALNQGVPLERLRKIAARSIAIVRDQHLAAG